MTLNINSNSEEFAKKVILNVLSEREGKERKSTFLSNELLLFQMMITGEYDYEQRLD
jgi:hypothetical protein